VPYDAGQLDDAVLLDAERETLRRLVADRAAAAGLRPHRAATVVLAIHELVTNSIRHTGCGGTLRVWTEPGELVCQVEDRGHILDGLAGRRRRAAAGEGLWIVNHVSDLVEVRTGGGDDRACAHAGCRGLTGSSTERRGGVPPDTCFPPATLG
jgi:anti-sigma regulatory factor (Ser/Thr protein kinase)